MTSAYVLIKIKAGKIRDVLKQLRKIHEIRHIDPVTGPYDIIGFVEAPDLATLGKLVLDKIQAIEGIEDTLTCNVITFEV